MIINKEKNRFTIRVSLPLIGENGEKWNDILNDEKEDEAKEAEIQQSINNSAQMLTEYIFNVVFHFARYYNQRLTHVIHKYAS